MKAASAEPRIIGSIHLAGIRESVPHARSEVRRWLGEDHPAVEDAVLAASELVTNALRHSDVRPYDLIGLTVAATEETVYVEVCDPGSAFSGPHIRQEPEAEDGRGLLIVREISQEWGTREHGRGLGRTVWCAIRVVHPSGLSASSRSPAGGRVPG
ncbi:ATP-binding protein [Nonomuraea cavernae]|uniref:ATP-binding protein n=1 Tax=Nonomuraea cavernae TaxID=2045107 RepID=A0A917YW33_9ACTN|nr:ATP-binding protein [Nonomuraea cavernae]MCA2185396.1 ATP-binding protein [Nonomuraea cavernae]GGO66340.1 ATP-binding protein [Nonomuraea cavernae]